MLHSWLVWCTTDETAPFEGLYLKSKEGSLQMLKTHSALSNISHRWTFALQQDRPKLHWFFTATDRAEHQYWQPGSLTCAGEITEDTDSKFTGLFWIKWVDLCWKKWKSFNLAGHMCWWQICAAYSSQWIPKVTQNYSLSRLLIMLERKTWMRSCQSCTNYKGALFTASHSLLISAVQLLNRIRCLASALSLIASSDNTGHFLSIVTGNLVVSLTWEGVHTFIHIIPHIFHKLSQIF